MTDFILGAIAAITMAVATFSINEPQFDTTHQLNEQQQIEIYEQVMDECVLPK